MSKQIINKDLWYSTWNSAHVPARMEGVFGGECMAESLCCSPETTIMLLILLFSHSVVSNSLWLHGMQRSKLSCPSPSPGTCSNSYHPTISSSVAPFSSCLQSCPASGFFLMNQLFASGGQSIGASVSASVLLMNIQGWFPLVWTGLISLLSKRLARVFSNTAVQKHQFFGVQPSLWSNSYIHIWLLEKS